MARGPIDRVNTECQELSGFDTIATEISKIPPIPWAHRLTIGGIEFPRSSLNHHLRAGRGRNIYTPPEQDGYQSRVLLCERGIAQRIPVGILTMSETHTALCSIEGKENKENISLREFPQFQLMPSATKGGFPGSRTERKIQG